MNTPPAHLQSKSQVVQRDATEWGYLQKLWIKMLYCDREFFNQVRGGSVGGWKPRMLKPCHRRKKRTICTNLHNMQSFSHKN